MFTLFDLAKKFDGEVIGDGNCQIKGVGTLGQAGEGDITFLSNPKYGKFLKDTSASAVIVSEQNKEDLNSNGLVVADPYVVYAKVATLLYPQVKFSDGVHSSADIAESACVHSSAYIGAQCVIGEAVSIGASSYIGPGCVIEADTQIGDECVFTANVTICHHSKIGNRNIYHPGVVIGADGFGLANEADKWIKIPQVGRVVIGDDVEIGANTCVDRGAIEDTIIEDGVKLDNLIQIGHNAHIGENTAIAAGTGVAGSVKIGRNCRIGGKVGIVGHLEIADNVQVTGMSLVTRSIKEPGTYSSGTPLMSNHQWHRNAVRFKQLDDMARRIKQLEKCLEDKK